jgi:hypothetical protein
MITKKNKKIKNKKIPSTGSDSLLEMAGVQEEPQKRSRAHTVTQGSGKRSKRN